jgi:hypothetical protein
MAALSATTLLDIWETGQGRHAIDRALAILAAAWPDRDVEELASLPVGQRDARLLTVYEDTFGPQLEGLASCPGCRSRLEFNLNAADIRLAPPEDQGEGAFGFTVEGFEVRYRLPNSFDLAAVALQGDSSVPVESKRHLLVQRCVLQATYEGNEAAVIDLPETVLAAIVEQMAEHDPQAEVLLDLDCPDCGHKWQVLFDIVPFAWAKIAVRAQSLLNEVHVLARAYGWREADILGMSGARRRFYLDRVM